MTLNRQQQLVSRIQADLRKEANAHRRNGQETLGADCEGQADGLDAVIATLSETSLCVAGLKKLMETEQE